MSGQHDVRPAAMAGQFYPGRAAELAATVDALLAAAPQAAPADPPFAIIAPHAGYIYSGAVAARVFARLAPFRGRIRRVAILGPAHRVALRGIALSSARAFATPLGAMPQDTAALDALRALPFVQVNDEAHRQEHALEVQLPFLQRVLGDVEIVPMVVGQASTAEVAQAIEAVVDDHTLVLVSTDLSHYHDHDTATRIDTATCTAIEQRNPAGVADHGACGRIPVRGLLAVLEKRGMTLRLLDRRTSGDTAGTRERVVGYAAFESDPRPRDGSACGLAPADQDSLLGIAEESLRHGLRHGAAPPADSQAFAPALAAFGACFVTITKGGVLRGCIGSLAPHRPLGVDASANAFAAGFGDPRFPALTADEWPGLALSLSVLTPAEPFPVRDEADLLARLRPGIDGLILRDGPRRATFLPQVWEQLPDPKTFLAHLRRKAGLPPDHWSPGLRFARYSTQSFGRPATQPL